jgi:hypothetical protein
MRAGNRSAKAVIVAHRALSVSRRRVAAGVVSGAVVVAGLLGIVVPLALAAPPSFPDVPETHPYFAAITDLASRGAIGGYADGHFGPSDQVTRQQFAKMIVLAAGYPVSEADVCPFRDVARSGAAGLFPDNYVAVCAARGITTGKTATTFDPYGNITRYQVVSMAMRTADDLRPGLLTPPPAAWTAGFPWAGDPFHGANAARAAYNGLLVGLDLAALEPSAAMTRGEVAQVLYNLLAKVSQPVVPRAVTLSVSVPGGNGKVAVTPEQTAFDKGQTVTLKAVPAAGYAFAGWSGDAEGFDNPLTLLMDSDKSVLASFAVQTDQFEDLGGVITSAPAVCSRGSGLFDVFARSSSGSLVHRAWNGANWSAWEDLGGTVKAGSDPVTVSWGINRLDVLVRGSDDALRHKWWDGNSWSEWESLATGLSAGPAAAYRDTGGGQKWLDVFILDEKNGLLRRTFDGTAWGEWITAGRGGLPLQAGVAPTAVTWGNVRVDLFVRGADGTLWHSYLPPSGDWSPWEGLDGSVAAAPGVCTWWSWAEGRLDMFARGADMGLWHRALISGVWSNWENMQLGAIGSTPAVISTGPDRFEIFVRGTNGALWHKTWIGSSWLP